MPFFADQFFWAEGLRALGLGPRPVSRSDLTVDALAAAMETTLGGPGVKSACAAAASRLDREDGVATAVSVLESYLGRVVRGRSRLLARPTA